MKRTEAKKNQVKNMLPPAFEFPDTFPFHPEKLEIQFTPSQARIFDLLSAWFTPFYYQSPKEKA
ncbi:MAG: hypothetical protein KDD41_00555 [Flavobacteriales bacterium]|nr:hypothetical protein [Flavobacteriales bacterium]